MVVTKDRPHGPGRSIPMFIVVECEDHSAIQAPLPWPDYLLLQLSDCMLETCMLLAGVRVHEYL